MPSWSCVHATCVTGPISNEKHFPYTKAHTNPKCDDYLRPCFHFITTHQNTISTVWMIHGGSTEITVDLLLHHHSRRMRQTLLPMEQSYSLLRSGKPIPRNSTFESWLPESQTPLMRGNYKMSACGSNSVPLNPVVQPSFTINTPQDATHGKPFSTITALFLLEGDLVQKHWQTWGVLHVVPWEGRTVFALWGVHLSSSSSGTVSSAEVSCYDVTGSNASLRNSPLLVPSTVSYVSHSLYQPNHLWEIPNIGHRRTLVCPEENPMKTKLFKQSG